MKRTAVVIGTLALAGAMALPAMESPAPAVTQKAQRATTEAARTADAAIPPYAVNRRATISVRFRAAVRGLPVARQTPRGYDRDKFGDWRDADGDCRDTRAEVLRAESLRAVTGRCTVVRGRWFSAYDHRTWRRASDVDIDHLVPLFEVWRSGGKRWGPARRVAYANDLADARTLRAVTDNVNQSKGDQDPSTWQPPLSSYRCTYSKMWITVKYTWGLRLQSAEKSALQTMLNTCAS